MLPSIDSYIFDLPPWQQEIVERLRTVILQTTTGIVETIKFRIPYYEYKKHLCYINPRKDEVILGLVQGKILSESNPILVGNQQQVRHIIIKENQFDDELEDQIRFVMQEAVLLNDELYKTSKHKWKP